MRKTLVLAMIFVAVTRAPADAQSSDAAKQQHTMIGVASANTSADVSKDLARQWFPEACLGLFICWGISSVDGNHDLSWGMIAHCPFAPKSVALTPEAYWRLADRFNPQQYHPEHWLQAAKDAGFGYAVLTTRHHDSYALWPSQYGELSTRTKLGGRDLVREYVEACRKVGLKVGFYYSPPEWYFNREYLSFGYGTKGTAESPHLGLWHEPVQLPRKPADLEDRYLAYVNGQVTELMTRYRTRGEKADSHRLAVRLLSALVKCRAWGGNMLANCGPRPSGEMPDSYYRCMEMLKAWKADPSEGCARRRVAVATAVGTGFPTGSGTFAGPGDPSRPHGTSQTVSRRDRSFHSAGGHGVRFWLAGTFCPSLQGPVRPFSAKIPHDGACMVSGCCSRSLW